VFPFSRASFPARTTFLFLARSCIEKRGPRYTAVCEAAKFSGHRLAFQTAAVTQSRDQRSPAVSVYVQITGGRGGRWHLECGDAYNGGVIDPCEAATSIGLENAPRSDTLLVILR